MADIPDDAVVGRIEDVVQRRGQLDHAEAGAKVAAGNGHGVDRLGAQLVGDLAQVALRKLPKIGRRDDRVEEGRLRGFRHVRLFRSTRSESGPGSPPWTIIR